MKEENIDKLVKETLSGFQPQPSNRVWSGIEASLDHQLAPPKSSFQIFAYISAAIIVLIASLGVLYFRSCTTTSSAEISTSKRASANGQTLNINKEQLDSDITTLSSRPKNNLNLIAVAKHAESTLKSVQKVVFKTSKPKIATTNLVLSSTGFDESFVGNNSKESGYMNVDIAVLPESQIENSTSAIQVETVYNAESSADNSITDNSNLTFSTPLLSENQDTMILQSEPAQPPSTNDNLAPLMPNSPNALKGIRFASCWSIDAFGGPSYLSSNKKSVFLFESPKVNQYINDNGFVKANFGMNARYHLNNWFVNTGISFGSYGENLNVLMNVDVTDTTGYLSYNTKLLINYDTIGYFDDPFFPGIIYPILSLNSYIDTIGSNWNTIDTTYIKSRSFSSNNRAQYIDVPLMLGYQLVFNKFIFELSSGVSVAINISKNGSFISKNSSTAFSETINPYRPVVFNYQLAAGLGYQLNNRLAFMLRPTYRTNLNSVLQPGFGIETRYHAFGINLGINYKIK